MNAQRQKLLERIEALIEASQHVTFIVPDETGYFSIEDELVQRVRRLIRDAVDLVGEVMDVYDAESPPDPALDAAVAGAEDDFLKEIGAAISSELAAREIANMAFVARAQLMENHEGLEMALENRHIWVVASNADTGLRRVSKGLIALESAIREYEGLEPVDRRWSDLGDSLEIRRLYGQFRRAILRGGEQPAADELEARLRGAARRITILRDLEIYPFLRIYDRVPIRRLQKRILAWLERDPGDAERLEDGRRLWGDLVSFAELLAQINHREDLREHDRKLVARLHRVLFEAESPPEKILPSHLMDLEQLLGRDDELDPIVLQPAAHRVEDLREPLERLRRELDQPYTPVQEMPLAPLM